MKKTNSNNNFNKNLTNKIPTSVKLNKNLITKNVNEISVDKDILDQFITVEKKNKIKESLSKFDVLKQELINLLSNNVIKMKNKDVFYFVYENILVPNLKTFRASYQSSYYYFNESEFLNKFDGFIGKLPAYGQVRSIINNYKLLGIEDRYLAYYTDDYYYININDNRRLLFNSTENNKVLCIPIFKLEEYDNILERFVANELIPENLSEDSIKMLKTMINMYKKNKIELLDSRCGIKFTESFIDDVLNNKVESLNDVSFKNDEIEKCIKNDVISLTDDIKKGIENRLLNCEKVRADIESYNVKRLEDPNLGHWDLWSDKKDKIKIDTSFVARNPIMDIKEDGIIGIDFGTKSTVVVYQNGNDNIVPMRVGMGQFSKKAEAKHYENPTVMEFINLENFLKCYSESSGRPNTLWEDVTVSHTAFNSLMSSQSDNYYAFFNDLKQWAGDNTRQIKIRDKNGYERLLKPYIDIKDNEFDPIELYAYYIGLYINNMHNGIYMHYLLSFPVTYEKKVRDKIINSFQKGIKKSLPEYILDDEDTMKKFRVEQGPSEPAAYAICALEEYGFDPEDDEKVFYGIFDFGGGTTDFDFGIWRSADEEKESRYDYVIEHFGAGGDQFLGGENLLELLSFEVFKANQDNLRKDRISFTKPRECNTFPGSEILISNSEEAKLNMKQVMEKLRPLWERNNGYEKIYESGIIKVNLFDEDGNLNAGYELDISKEELEKILYERIEKGVRNFFEALKLTFKNEITKSLNKIIIFLAGNSCKSPIVLDIFNKYISKITKELNTKNNSEDEYFVIYPPLGSKEAIEIQNKKGIKVDENDITRPTGKTGVAFGLVEGRDGGVIKIISEKAKTNEIKFNYYIGRNRKKKFKTIMDRDIEYGKWVKFISAEKEDFELYYTNLPEATTNNLTINDISKKSGRIAHANENGFIYIRAVEPSVIEYIAATEEDIKSNKIDNNKVQRVRLK